jgi:Putative cyclase
MITLLLHLFRVLPFLFGGHRQLALENLALRQQLAVYKRTVSRPPLRRTHSGTHLDALGHVWRDRTMWNGRSADAVTSQGVAWGGVHMVPGLVGRGVLLDIAGHRGVPQLGLGEPRDRASENP